MPYFFFALSSPTAEAAFTSQHIHALNDFYAIFTSPNRTETEPSVCLETGI